MSGGLVRQALRPLATTLITLGLVLLAWMLFLRVFDVSPLMGKSPAAVLHYLFETRSAGRHRAALLSALGVTLLHAGSGFLLGLVSGAGAAMLFVLRPSVERSLMPVAMILRSVPLVAMTPLIVLVFGRGPAAVAVIGAIIVFFPTLVNTALGLRAVPALSADLIRVHGGSDWTILRKVGLPTALPALFAGIRLSVPAALVGALLAEWLATGDGLGNRMQRDITTFQSADLWSAVVLITLCSLALYALVGLVEALVGARSTAG